MGSRFDLQTLLESVLKSENVYFQPPASKSMTYPCIVYSRNSVKLEFANNLPYTRKKSYTVIVIDKNPDSKIPDEIGALPYCSFNRHYTADNLNHDVFTMFY